MLKSKFDKSKLPSRHVTEGPKRAPQLFRIVPMAMVLVQTKEALQFADGLRKSLVDRGAMVAPDIFDGLENLLFHDGHGDQPTV